jgi:hypothetical protein
MLGLVGATSRRSGELPGADARELSVPGISLGWVWQVARRSSVTRKKPRYARQLPNLRTYPHGYDLTQLGTFPVSSNNDR